MFDRSRDRVRREMERAQKDAKQKQQEAEFQRKQHEQFLQVARRAQERSEYLEKLRGEETHYANTVVLLGFGGFFALWTSISAQLAKPWFGLLGLSAAISLLFFVGFELTKTIAVARAINAACARDADGHRTHGEAAAVNYIQAKADAVNRLWVWFFAPSAITGLLAGFGLLGFFIWKTF